ncbi:MAG: YezD family protein [Geobacteraceae bacterium]
MTRTNAGEQQNNRDSDLEQRILTALKEIRFGTLSLIIQDGKVIQIDKNEKIRLI